MLKAGLAAVDITPPAGVRQGGYEGRTLPSLAVHDPLWARALVLDDGIGRVGLVGLDLVSVPDVLLEEVRKSGSAYGVPGASLLLAATHTHSGPDLRSDPATDLEREYIESLPTRVGEAVQRAVAGLAGVSLAIASGWSAVGINRRELVPGNTVTLGRNAFGPFDPELGVLRVADPAGRTVGVVMNYAAHALCLGEDNYLITADYPGHAVHYVEDRIGRGVTAIFFNGAAGDVNPREGPVYHGIWNGGSFLAAQHAGDALATEAIRVLSEAEDLGDATIRCASRKIQLPTNWERAINAAEARLKGLEGRRADPSYHFDRYLVWDQETESAEAARRHVERLKAQADKPVEMEVQAIAVGDLAFVGWPGEVFCEFGKMVKRRSPFRRTYILGYANGCVGYVPTLDAYRLGGYEVESAFHLADHAGTVLADESVSLLGTLT